MMENTDFSAPPIDPPMIVRIEQSGGVVRTNSAFESKVGISEEELAKKPFIDWVHPDDQATLQQEIERGDGKCQVRHQTSTGDWIQLDALVRDQGEGIYILARCIKTGGYIPHHYVGEAESSVKCTLHKLANIVEEQNPGYKCSILLVSHDRFVRGAGPSLPEEYNNAIDGFAIGPTVGACGTAIYWNVPVVVEDIQNDPLWVPFAELAKKAGVAACWSTPFATNGGRVLGALALYSPEPRRPTSEQLSRLEAAAQMTGLAVERGRAEEELRSANEVKARFMANMSHEIRTPLNALIGITDSLLDIDGGEQTSEIKLLRESSEQLLELFTGVLELTEVQDRTHHGKRVDLPECFEGIFEPFEAAARLKGLKFEHPVSKRLPQWGTIDEWALQRGISLLIDDALKFTDEGQVKVAVEFDNQELSIEISDSGCGIDLGRLQDLRDPFVQGDLSTTKQYGGFGLGLAVSDLCMSALGSKLEYKRNEWGGTTVSCCIPVDIASTAGGADHSEHAGDEVQTSLPILVVEDNPINSKVIERILVKTGYEFLVAENGAVALQIMEENDFCCILMDCQMPVMDGYEATRRIRENEKGTENHIPIIAVTANALADDRDICLDAGMDDYLKKPVRRAELAGALETYAGKPAGQAS
jgi:signal transduction histidine kinase/ActR/RegA family two-component response regulator